MSLEQTTMETLITQLPPGVSVQTSLGSLQLTLPVLPSSSGPAGVFLRGPFRIGAVFVIGFLSCIAYLAASMHALMLIEKLIPMGKALGILRALVLFAGFGGVLTSSVVQSNRKIKAYISKTRRTLRHLRVASGTHSPFPRPA